MTDLVGRGRYPYQGWFRHWTAADDQAVAHAPPREVVTRELVRQMFDLDSLVVADPVSQTPTVVPIERHHCADPARTQPRSSGSAAHPAACAAAAKVRGWTVGARL